MLKSYGVYEKSSSIISKTNYNHDIFAFHLKTLETQSYYHVVSEMKPVAVFV